MNPVEVRFGAELAERLESSGERASSPVQLVERIANELALHGEAVTGDGGLRACVACGHPELYTRKDFPRAIGIAIVVLAALFAPITYYASLAAAALLDFLLYRLAGDVVQCYSCESEHRGFGESPRHPAFDREIDERLKYGTKAVMGKAMREGGTADAPDPEH